MSKNVKEDRLNKWMIASVLATGFVLVLGVIQILMPNSIDVGNDFVGQFGRVVILISLAAFMICALSFSKVEKKKSKIRIVFLSIVCVLVALLGYVAQWWFS